VLVSCGNEETQMSRWRKLVQELKDSGGLRPGARPERAQEPREELKRRFNSAISPQSRSGTVKSRVSSTSSQPTRQSHKSSYKEQEAHHQPRCLE
jgi:hypothetical protein